MTGDPLPHNLHDGPRLTLAQAAAGIAPRPFTRAEWAAMHEAALVLGYQERQRRDQQARTLLTRREG